MADAANPCLDASPDLDAIYLQPRCCADFGGVGRLWCEDPQEPCESCGAPWIKFARAPGRRRGRRANAPICGAVP